MQYQRHTWAFANIAQSCIVNLTSGLIKRTTEDTNQLVKCFIRDIALIQQLIKLSIPVLLVLGILTRPTAIALFILNIVVMTSYPDISATCNPPLN